MLYLLACVADDVLLAPDRPPVPASVAEALLLPDPWALPDRAAPRRFGPAAWSHDDPPFTDPEPGWGDPGRLPVVEAADRVAVVEEHDAVRLVLWLDRADLHPRVARDVRVGADGRPVGEEAPGVWLPAGHPVADDGTLRLLGVSLEGELPLADALVDEVWTAEPDPPPPAAPDVTLLAGAALTDERDAVLATVSGGFAGPAGAETLARADGRRRVRVRTDGDGCGPPGGYEVVGWVDEAAVVEGRRGGGGAWCCGGVYFGWGAGSAWPATWFDAGTLLHDTPGGAVVGVLTADRALGTGEATEDGWTAVTAWTRWGRVSLWTAPGAEQGDAADLDDLDAALAAGGEEAAPGLR